MTKSFPSEFFPYSELAERAMHPEQQAFVTVSAILTGGTATAADSLPHSYKYPQQSQREGPAVAWYSYWARTYTPRVCSKVNVDLRKLYKLSILSGKLL